MRGVLVFVLPGMHVEVKTPDGLPVLADLPGSDVLVPGLGAPGYDLDAEQILGPLEDAGLYLVEVEVLPYFPGVQGIVSCRTRLDR